MNPIKKTIFGTLIIVVPFGVMVAGFAIYPKITLLVLGGVVVIYIGYWIGDNIFD